MFLKSGACIAGQRSAINVVDEQPEGGDIDPHLRYSQPVNVLAQQSLNYMLLPHAYNVFA